MMSERYYMMHQLLSGLMHISWLNIKHSFCIPGTYRYILDIWGNISKLNVF